MLKLNGKCGNTTNTLFTHLFLGLKNLMVFIKDTIKVNKLTLNVLVDSYLKIHFFMKILQVHKLTSNFQLTGI